MRCKMNLAVVLLSDQSIPNVLFLKDFSDKWDKILFIETERTKEKNYSKSILSVLEKKEYDQITIDENDLSDIESKLEEYFLQNSFDHILVNITGGTKIMALGAYDFFKNRANLKSTIYYKPINKDPYLIFHPKAGQVKPVYKLSIEEYMSAVGIKIKNPPKNEDSLKLKSKIARILFKAFESNYETMIDIAQKLEDYHKDESLRKKIDKQDDFKKVIKDLRSYCNISEDDLNQFDFKKNDTITFFRGGWFEYYTYEELKKLNPDDIKCNLIIEVEGNSKVSNELDVVFIINNALHIVECKTGETKDFIGDTIYKASQIRQQFGLSAISHLVILNLPNSKINEQKKERAKVFNIHLIDYDAISQKSIADIFKEQLKLP